MKLDYCLRSVTGKRPENQDELLYNESPFGSTFILADGMGGHHGGALASALATSKCAGSMSSLPDSLAPDEALQQSIYEANRLIFDESKATDPALRRMGSTIVALLVSQTPDGMLAIGAHVGDSRLYFVREKRLFCLTQDHTVTEQLLNNNTLTKEQAQGHPQAGMLTRALGQRDTVDVDLTPWMLIQDEDTFLLCSDGLSGFVDDSAICHVLSEESSSSNAADQLVDLALRLGSDDNVSVAVVKVVPAAD